MAGGNTERRVPANPLGRAGNKILVAPFQLWMDGADHLRLEGWSAAADTTLQAFGRVLRDDGEIEPFQTFIFAPDTVTRVVQDLPMPKGFLLSLIVNVTGAAPLIGQVFTRASLIRGFTGATVVTATLLQGYVNAAQVLSWPGTPLQQADAVPGYGLQIISTGALPGQLMQFTVPTGEHYSVLGAQASLQCDATAATRRAYLFPSSANQAFFSHHTQTVLASGFRSHYWAIGLTGNIDAASTQSAAALPTRVELDAGEQIRIFATNMQAGDQFTGGLLSVLARLQVT